jgi:hypothetical protein
MQRSLDYNDVIATADKGDVQMHLFYMCAMACQKTYDPSAKLGIYMPGKFWSRKGAPPVKCQRWYCDIEKSEWAGILTRHLMPEAGGRHTDFQLEHALEGPNIGCDCRFHPFQSGGSMVLEVIDQSVEGVCTMYAIRAAIPPAPLSDEIQKVQKEWVQAGLRTSAADLYAAIPVMYPKCHLIPGTNVPAFGKFPVARAI